METRKVANFGSCIEMPTVVCMKCGKKLLSNWGALMFDHPAREIINVICLDCFNEFKKMFEELSKDINKLKGHV